MNHQGHYSKMELENGSETLIIIKSWILLARDSEEKIPGIRSDSDTVAAAEQLSSGCFPQNTLQTSLIESPLVVEITARIVLAAISVCAGRLWGTRRAKRPGLLH
ncbi:uncharacterized protein AB9X84_006777 isoform 2-T2 [Acanthopagrus schlegelii]